MTAIELATPCLSLLDNINNDELAHLLYQKRHEPVDNTLLALLQRLIHTLEELALDELQSILNQRQTQAELNEDYVKAFISGTIAYLGKDVTLDHLLSRDMPESVVFQGTTLNDFDLVALAAIFKGDEDILRVLLDLGRVGKGKDFYSVALYLAFFIGDVKVYALLLNRSEFGPNDLYSLRRGNIFTCAAKNGHIELIDFLLNEGVQAINSKYFPLHEAASNGHQELVRKLLRAGFDVNAINDAGETPLHAAVRSAESDSSKHNSIPIIKSLLDGGANPTQNTPASTALQLAARYGNHGAAELLLQAGADPNFAPKGTDTPLIRAIESGDIETVNILLKYGANIHQVSKRHGNALIASIKKGEEAMFDLFLKNFDSNTTDTTGASALYFAAAGGHEGMVLKLINNGANILANHNTVFSATMGAGLSGNSRIVRTLSQKGVHDDHAALYAASSAGEDELVTRLLLDGADIGHCILPFDRDLSLHAAMIRGHESTVRLLLGAGATCSSRHFPSFFLETASRRYFGIAKLVLNTNTTGPIRLCLTKTPVMDGGKIPIALLLLTLKAGARAGNVAAAWEFIQPYGQDVVEFMEYLLSQDANVKLPVDSPKSAFRSAIESHNLALFTFLLDCYGANISADHPNLIELVVANNDLSTLEHLLQRVMEEKEPKSSRWQLCLDRALMAALEQNSYPMVEMLARYGAFSKYSSYPKSSDVETDGHTPTGSRSSEFSLAITAVETAMKKRNELVVRFLVALGVLDHVDSGAVQNILSKAERHRCPFVLEVLNNRRLIG
ncbi:ankyrin [Arthroderma uncinatum]|uniref:ankyrin n=1 Tax=Arthroderma uncinatum TaxID=74035 RepID=UPI00144A6705|nr:ankyrin [Arthroderma uncinatum]KAF3483995.1 ankyrin [Arthroderma uncinatum]